MKKTFFLALFSAFLLTGCGAMAVAPVTGFLYTGVKGAWTATSNTGSSKEGSATCTSILGWIGTGDCSISAAAQNGGISKIHHVDYKSTSILAIYATHTVLVYGE